MKASTTMTRKKILAGIQMAGLFSAVLLIAGCGGEADSAAGRQQHRH